MAILRLKENGLCQDIPKLSVLMLEKTEMCAGDGVRCSRKLIFTSLTAHCDDGNTKVASFILTQPISSNFQTLKINVVFQRADYDVTKLL